MEQLITQASHYPQGALSQFIDVIWMGKGAHIDTQSPHHAPLFTELIFNFADDFLVEGQNIAHSSHTAHDEILSGLKTTPFITTASGAYGSVGLILKPFCYGILIEKLGSHTLTLLAEILYDNLIDTPTPQFDKLEQPLLKLFGDPQLDSDFIKFEHFIDTELLDRGALRRFNLSISISQKSFIQKFKRYYLLTPNDYIKLKKVHAAMTLLQGDELSKLVEVGLDAGFYDQSHFIKVFKQFCGYTPKEHPKKGSR